MRLVTYESSTGPRVAGLRGGTLVDLNRADPSVPSCVKALLAGRKPPIPDHPVCVECKLKENVCLFTRGQVCLGPVTRAGCGAICPSYGQACDACRGFTSHPNDASLRALLQEHGLTPEEVQTRYTLFATYQVRAQLAHLKSPPGGERKDGDGQEN